MKSAVGLPALPEGFWERVAGAHDRLLAFDYDGTLAPIRVPRERALPTAGVLPALRALSADPATAVAVLSGRPVAELLALLVSGRQEELDRIQLLGEHGWERLRPGELQRHALPPAVAELLRRAEETAADAGWSDLLERKRTAVVLHTRTLAADDARAVELRCRMLWSTLMDCGDLRLDEIDGGLELRASARDKGTAIRELLAESPPGTLLVYVGDDETDEDVFRQIGQRGFGLRVTHRLRPTAAVGTLGSCVEVLHWLERLRDLILRRKTPFRDER